MSEMRDWRHWAGQSEAPEQPALGAQDDRPLGICDGCGRIVRASGRGIAFEIDASTPDDVAAAIGQAALAAAWAGRCRVCNMTQAPWDGS